MCDSRRFSQALLAEGKSPVMPSKEILGAEISLVASFVQCGHCMTVTDSSTYFSLMCALAQRNSNILLAILQFLVGLL
jgi:hypothetical protein